MLCLFSSGLRLTDSIQQEVEAAGISNPLFQSLSGRMADYLVTSRSDNTYVKYFSYFKKWESFIKIQGGCAIPASPIHVALYLTDLMDKHYSYSVISASLYSIKWAHSMKNLQDPTNNAFVTNLLESAKRNRSKPIVKKQPVTPELLVCLCEKYSESTDVLVVRDLCMIVLGFSAFLRYDEISNVRCNDIKIEDTYFCLNIRKSKTDQYRFGNEVVISKGNSAACPYSMLLRYLSITDQSISSFAHLFRPCFRSKAVSHLISKDKPLSYSRARECLISRLKEVAGDLNVGLHSLRAGGASAAANAGVNDRCWKRHGRWKSETSKDGYAADSLERRLEVSKKLGL